MTTTEPTTVAPRFVWLEITGRCQLTCDHCYAGSGPDGTHGTMTATDWRRVIDQAAELGVDQVQFIGGEPTLHADLPELVRHALTRGLRVEVFTNLVHVTEAHWAVFQLPGVQLATSYYSDDPAQHAAITGRPSHARTKANIDEAVRRGIKLRAGVIGGRPGQRADQAAAQLDELGVAHVGRDRVRALGRGARAQQPSPTELCGRCGDGTAAIRPDGSVAPCVMTRWLATGNVHQSGLAEATASIPAARAELTEQGMPPRGARGCHPDDCPPDGGECYPTNEAFAGR